MKRLLTAIFLLLPVICLAQKQDYDNWIYEGDKSITEYCIPTGEKKIGNHAFENCNNLTHIILPSTVEEIRGVLFHKCDALQTIEVSRFNTHFVAIDGVLYNKDTTEIVCFPPAKSFSNYVIPKSVSVIGYGAFFGCNDIEDLKIPDHITEIHESAFEECGHLRSVYIPASVREIRSCAFSTCYNLKKIEVDIKNIYYSSSGGVLFNSEKTELVSFPNSRQDYTIPSTVRTIGKYSFQGCKDLKSITIPNSVTIIDDGAFSYCESIESIRIPKSVKIIGEAAFWNMTNLIEINIPDGIKKIGSGTFKLCKQLATVKLPKSVKTIGAGAFLGCFKLDSIVLPTSVVEIGEGAFAGCFSLTSITIPKNVREIGSSAFLRCGRLTNVTMQFGVQKIGSNAFERCEGLFEITIPGSVKNIPEDCFYESGLRRIIIENGVETIDEDAFDCEQLSSIFIPASVKKLSGWIFRFAKIDSLVIDSANPYYVSIDNVIYSADQSELIFVPSKHCVNYVIPPSVRKISEHACREGKFDTLSIPDSVKEIGEGAFCWCRAEKIEIGNGVEKIGKEAFGYCSGIREISIPGSVKEIGEGAFSSCSDLEKIKIKNGVEKIGKKAFSFSGVKEIAIPGSVKEIGEYAFMNSSCTNVSISYGVTQIGGCAFQDCDNLQEITIPGSVKVIGVCAFRYCDQLSKVIIGDGVEIIGMEAFGKCENLTSVYLPGSIREIGDRAFDNLTSISCLDNSSSTVKIWTYKCMMDVHKQHSRNDSVQYYVDKITDIIQTQSLYEKDFCELYRGIAGYYRECCDFSKVKFYSKRGVETCNHSHVDVETFDRLLLLYADACLSLKEYSQADSVFTAIEKYHGLLRKPDVSYVDSCRTHFQTNIFQAYYYLLLKMFFETNEIQKVNDYFTSSIRGHYGVQVDYIGLADEWLRINAMVLDNLSLSQFEEYKSWRSSDAHGCTTIGDCYLHYNLIDSAFAYYSKSFEYEFQKLKQQFSYMNIYQRQYYWEEHKPSFDNIVKISTKLPDYDIALGMAYNSLLISKGLLLASEESLSNTIQNSKDEKLKSDYYKLKYYRTQMDTITNPVERARLVELAGRLETDLMHRSSQFADVVNYMSVDWQKVRNSLGKNDVVIEFFTEEDTVYALILKRDFDAPKLIKLSTCNFNNPYYSYEMYHSIWQPLERYLTPKSNIYFSPSGQLHTIAIENAMIDQNTSISDKYRIFRLSSTRNLALRRNTSKSKSALIYGNILYNANLDTIIQNDSQYRGFDRGWNHLDDKGEIDSINLHLSSNGYKTTIMTQYEATEKSFKALSNNNYSIIHLSTHGVYENSIDDPMQSSALIFAGANDLDIRPDTIDDGILSAQEISYLNLKNTDLVVLSACVSGLGEITSEGVFGLQRGFKKAGANTIVMSLRNVNNFYTKQFMLLFYHNLSKGIQKHDAFVEAQREFRHLYPDPKIQNEALFIMLDGEK